MFGYDLVASGGAVCGAYRALNRSGKLLIHGFYIEFIFRSAVTKNFDFHRLDCRDQIVGDSREALLKSNVIFDFLSASNL